MRKSPYNAEYIMQRENLNRDDAEKFIENYKLNKATSLNLKMVPNSLTQK